MTAFKNTIVGRILKGTAKVALPVLGAITGIGAISGAAKGIGALAGIGGAIKDTGGFVGKIGAGVKKVIDKVGVSAVNLATGTTQPERAQVREIKARTKSEVDKWDQVDRLIRAGASRAEAMLKVGVSDEEVSLTSYQGVVNKPDNKMLYIAGAGLLGLLLLPKILKR